MKPFRPLAGVWLLAVVVTLPRQALAQEIVEVAGGGNHSLARDACGGVWAWGGNANGQLGDGTTTPRATPIRVIGLATGVRAITASGPSFALLNNGRVMAWGPNALGQLGLGTVTVDELTPAQIPTLSGVTAISAGGSHALALIDGEVWAWGTNNEGQLGVGTIDSAAHPTPQKVPGLSGVTAIAASRNNDSYAIDAQGFIWAWGRNTVGQVGRNTGGAAQATPGRVLKSLAPGDYLGGVTAVAAANGGGAALKDGTVWTWGFNSNGQLGDGSIVNRPYAASVKLSSGALLSEITSLSGGTFFYLAGTANGTAWGWGQNANGQLGDGTTLDRAFAVQVVAENSGLLEGVASVAAGGSHSLALMENRTLFAWGVKGVGQLGDGTTAPFQIFVVAVRDSFDPSTGPLTGVDAIFAGGSMSGVLIGSEGRAWGANAFGQVGDGATENRLTPVPVAALAGATAVATSGSHTLSIRPDGTVLAWGLGTSGQLGNGVGGGGVPISSLTPVAVTGLGGVSAVSAMGNRSMALKVDGTVWTWGFNSTGQLGDGTITNRSSPVQVKKNAAEALTDIRAISASGAFSVAVKNDTTVWAWGQNNFGQVGDGSSLAAPRLFPVQVLTATGVLNWVTKVAAGGAHTLALKEDGTVWAWGQNIFGQLGNGTTTDSRTAVQVPGLSGVTAIAAGGTFSIALGGDGTVWAWGFNAQGQLADGTTTNRATAAPVMKNAGELLLNVTAIAAGGAHALARSDGGSVWSWGNNDSGQLGDGTDPNTVHPVPVAFPVRPSPTVSAVATPNVLRPPNHTYVPVKIAVTASDSCTGAPTLALLSATSSEADNGTGDGNATSDIGFVSRSGDTWTIQLRAERAGNGDGRVYTITFSATDAAANQTMVDVSIGVPH